MVLISGYDGGTGAAPLNAIKHAGTPWEIGLSETQQTLILNGLRSRVRIESDSKLLSGLTWPSAACWARRNSVLAPAC